MQWTRLDALPAGVVAYCRAGLDAYLTGARMAVHFQLPGDAITHGPDADRLRLVPDGVALPCTGPPAEPATRVAERAAAPTDATGQPSVKGPPARAARTHGE